LRKLGRHAEAENWLLRQELQRFESLVRAVSWDDIEIARADVRSRHVEGLVDCYWTLDTWPQRIALIQLVQDQTHPALKPIMLDVLHAPLEADRDNVALTKAIALAVHIDPACGTFEQFCEDREALHAAVSRVLSASGTAGQDRQQ
ncbi:hypothetical protein, partial [Priestia megaterium]|uniref:hypothetical protein n=1 Tax=Priestia megaterium TaxID=1404 RepID=UPI0036DA25AD